MKLIKIEKDKGREGREGKKHKNIIKVHYKHI
jgi:hypothetical protein